MLRILTFLLRRIKNIVSILDHKIIRSTLVLWIHFKEYLKKEGKTLKNILKKPKFRGSVEEKKC